MSQNRGRTRSLDFRNLVLECYDNGQDIKSIATQFHICTKSILNWESRRSAIGTAAPFPRASNVVPLISDDNFKWILDLCKSDPGASQIDLAEAINLAKGTLYNNKQICDAFKSHHITRQEIEYHASQQNAAERGEFMWIKRPPSQGGFVEASMMLFIDEAKESFVEIRPSHSYNSRGERAFKSTPFASGHGFFSTGIFSFSIEGMQTADPFEDTMINEELFEATIRQHVLPIMNAYPGARSIMCLDGSSVHDMIALQTMLDSIGAKLLCLPGYSYDYNPIELAFHATKNLHRYVYRHSDSNNPTADQFKHCALNCVTPATACAMFRHCLWEVTEEEELWACR